MNPVVYARIAGLAYLAIFVLAIGANFAVLESLVVAGDAEQTLANIVANETAFRAAIAALFIVLFADLVVAWAFFVMFTPLAPALTRLTVLFRIAYTIAHAPFVVSLVLALRAATSEASVMADPAASAYGYLIAHSAGFTYTLVFFGVHLILLAGLALKTRGLPAIIAVLVALAGLGYLLDGFGRLLTSELFTAMPMLSLLIVVPPALLGEGLLTLYLLIRGVDARRWPVQHAGPAEP